MGTVIVLIVVAGLAGLAVRKMINDKKNGKSCCSGDCRNCSGHCH